MVTQNWELDPYLRAIHLGLQACVFLGCILNFKKSSVRKIIKRIHVHGGRCSQSSSLSLHTNALLNASATIKLTPFTNRNSMSYLKSFIMISCKRFGALLRGLLRIAASGLWSFCTITLQSYVY